MQLHLSSWPEIEAYLATSKAILIPIGSTVFVERQVIDPAPTRVACAEASGDRGDVAIDEQPSVFAVVGKSDIEPGGRTSALTMLLYETIELALVKELEAVLHVQPDTKRPRCDRPMRTVNTGIKE